MRYIAILLLALTFSVTTAAADSSQHQMAEQVTYICPMHPHIEGEKGDRCPICGMDLVPKETKDKKKTSLEKTSKASNALVATAKATSAAVRPLIEGYADITYNLRERAEITVRTAGWITELQADAAGDKVKKGQVLFSYYSPELMTAQSDYLLSPRSDKSKQRLELFGMASKAIDQLQKRKEVMAKTPFYAPKDGFISALNVTHGSYVQAGQTVMVIDDTQRLWAEVDVPLDKLEYVQKGQEAALYASPHQQLATAQVDYIYPTIGSEKKGRVRLVVDNSQDNLKIGSYVTAKIKAEPMAGIVVPASAVVYGEDTAYVYVQKGEQYQKMPVDIVLNQHDEAVVAGIEEGASVVVSGQFMLDADSQLGREMTVNDNMDNHGTTPMTGDGEMEGNHHDH